MANIDDEAALGDIIQFLTDKHVHNQIAQEFLTVGVVVGLILFVIGADGLDIWARVRLEVRATLRSLSLEQHRVPLKYLTYIVNMFCHTHLEPQSMDMIRVNLQRPSKSGKGSGKSSALAPAQGHRQSGSSTHIVAAHPRQDYSRLTHSELQVQLGKRDTQIVSLQVEKARLVTSRSYYANRCADLRGELLLWKDAHKSLTEETCFRPGKRNVSKYGAYCMAIRGASGYASAQTTVKVIAGQKEQGGFKDKGIVIKYQHKACLGQRLLSSQDYVEHHSYEHQPIAAQEDAGCLAGPCETDVVIQHMEAHGVKADETNQEAIGKDKVHVCVVESASVTAKHIIDISDGAQGNDIEKRFKSSYTKTIADIQVVRQGTGEELLAMLNKELHSVSCPTWDERTQASRANSGLSKQLSLYCFGFDGGPGNIYGTRRICERLKGDYWVMMTIILCFMHQHHLIIAALLVTIDHWDFGPEFEQRTLNPLYFSAVATISNTWRSAGLPHKLYTAAIDIAGALAASRYFKKIPGRALRGRWGSIDAVEALYMHCQAFLFKVFQKVLDPMLKKQRVEPAASVDAAGQQSYYDMVGTWRKNCLRSLSDKRFWIMVHVSSKIKFPIMRSMYHLEKKEGETNKLRREAEDNGEMYTGPTPLSELVYGYAKDQMEEFNSLLRESTSTMEWMPVWSLIKTNQRASTICLIVTLVIQGASGYWWRIVLPSTTLPLSILLLIKSPRDVVCRERMGVAAEILDTADCCLVRMRSDVALKMQHVFRTDLEFAKTHGLLTNRLWAFVTLARGVMSHATQDVEGLNSIIKHITDIAPYMQLPLVNSRLSLKKGKRVTPRQCSDMEKEIKERQGSPENVGRFVPLPIAGPEVPMRPDVACAHRWSFLHRACASVAIQISKIVVTGAARVCSLRR